MIELGVRSRLRRDVRRESAGRAAAADRSPAMPTLSEPLTSCPSSSRSAAMPLIPLPATPMRWIAMPLARQNLLRDRDQRRGVMIGWVYLSIVSTTSAAAFFGASRAEFSDMRCSLCRIVDQFADFSREHVAGEFRFLEQQSPPRRERKSPRCASDDRPPRRDTESGSPASEKAASSARLAAPERAIAKSAAL